MFTKKQIISFKLQSGYIHLSNLESILKYTSGNNNRQKVYLLKISRLEKCSLKLQE